MAKVIERLLRRCGYVREDALTVPDMARIGYREGIRFDIKVAPLPRRWVTPWKIGLFANIVGENQHRRWYREYVGSNNFDRFTYKGPGTGGLTRGDLET